MIAVIIVIAAVLMALCVMYRYGAVEWPWETIERCKKPKPEQNPAVGTIRIVEKMNTNGSVYYTAEWFHGDGWRRYCSGNSNFIHTDTAEEAQQEANDEADRCRAAAEEKAEKQRRADHHKVMGEFTP